ncbi:hypothetical protein FQN54_006862 [Arachnomyces sp. PD_36]|nr:hypothetical protein FQN54_006862 [Arachnomyces sp. PD_36]
MKPSIPPALWEKKRSQIAKLYKDEEWPLKHVIKQIRTEEFNPSETQLRSRLKKWRVTKPSRQCRKKSQDSPPYRAAVGMEAPLRSATTTPPSPGDDVPSATSTIPKAESSSPPSDPNWYWYPDSECRQLFHESGDKKALGGQSNPPSWVLPAIYPPSRNQSYNNSEPYKYPTVQTVSPIHTYTPQHSATSPISGTPVNASPPLRSPFTESAFPEICFSTLPPPEYEWSVQLRDDIRRTDIAAPGEYTSPMDSAQSPSKPSACSQEPGSGTLAGYANYAHSPPSKILSHTEHPPFIDNFSSIESFPESGPWRRTVPGASDAGLVEGSAPSDQVKQIHRPQQGVRN